MARRVFISAQHEDRMKAKGFNLMSHADNIDVEFTGRHLLDKVNSNNEAYIRQCVREQMHGTSVTVVLVGDETANSDWVSWEIEESLERGNGLLAIRIQSDAEVPSQLTERGAEVLDWTEPDDVKEFTGAIERAALAARRAPMLSAAKGGSCTR